MFCKAINGVDDNAHMLAGPRGSTTMHDNNFVSGGGRDAY